MLSIIFEIFLIASGKPGLGFGLSLAGGITNIILDYTLIEVIPCGVAGVAYATAAIILSVQTILSATYTGYIQRIAPVISFHYGSENYTELNKLYRIALKTIALLFAEGAKSVLDMAVRGTFIFAGAFLLMGFNLFASGFFTALNDGKTSAILSLFRTLIFLIIPLLVFPAVFGVDGVWISMPKAEVLSILLSVFYFKKMKSKYHYA